MRQFLRQHTQIEELIDFAGLKVFQAATVRTVIVITRNHLEDVSVEHTAKYLAPLDAERFQHLNAGLVSLSELVCELHINLSTDALRSDNWLLVSNRDYRILKHMEANATPLRHLIEDRVLWGVKTGLNDAFVIDRETRARILESGDSAVAVIKPFLFGEDARRYYVDFKDRFFLYMYHGIDIGAFPNVEAYLNPYKTRLEKRATKQAWYELQQPSVALVPIFERPKIVYPEIANRCQFALDRRGYFSNNKTFILPTDDLFLLGILNSKAAFFWFSHYCAALESARDRYLEFRAQYVREFPVPVQPSASSKSKNRKRMVELVERIATFCEKQKAAKASYERTALDRQIAATDRQIDALVYELYGLSDEEIRIVEEATAR